MARIIELTGVSKFEEKVTTCPYCNKHVAFKDSEVFIDLSYGPEHNGEHCISCPSCNNIIQLRVFQTTESMCLS